MKVILRGMGHSMARWPARWFGGLASAAIVSAIVLNVGFLQDGKHPAPLAGSLRPIDTLADSDRQMGPPLPEPRANPVKTTSVTPEPPAAQPKSSESVAAAPSAGSDPIARMLAEGDDGPGADVAADPRLLQVQTELQSLGMYDGTLDGVMGPRTKAAIASFEKLIGEAVTGAATDSLLAGLKSFEPAETPSETAALPAGVMELLEASPEPPRADPMVRAVQGILADLGYAPGPVDGLLGNDTRRAIEAFQADRGLATDGQVSDAFIRALEAFTGRPVG